MLRTIYEFCDWLSLNLKPEKWFYLITSIWFQMVFFVKSKQNEMFMYFWYLIFHQLQILLFDTSLGIAVQLSIIEPYGIMIIRFEKEISSNYSSSTTSSGGSGGKVYVFRLSQLEWFLVELMEWNHNVDSLLHNENNDFQVNSLTI